jgi:O-antigen ligase
MRSEQTLTARREGGPEIGPGGGALQSSRGRLDQIAAAAPVALLVGLALAGGGFEIAPRHLAGLGAWLVVVALLVFGAASTAQLRRPFYWAVGSILGLSLLSAISSFWSGSVELSVIEVDRVLVYLGIFLAAFLIAQTGERRQRFAEGLAFSLVAIALLGLASRLVPHVLQVSDSLGTGPRLRYPLGYWNANGAVFGIGIALLLWSSRQALSAAMRWLSVAFMPAVLLALYFTYSRGGLLALVVAAGCLIALSRDRLWLVATLAIGALGALPAVLAVQARRGLADNVAGQATIDQGVTVLLILLAGTVLALALFAGLRRLERSNSSLTGKALALSRHPSFLRGVAATIAVLAIAATAAVGGRAWHQFSSSDIQFPNQPEQHFSQLNGAGRNDFWRVALETFDEKPLQGAGAGTYEFAWEEKRSIELPVHDAHSLYLEAFAELGIFGGVLVLILVGSLLWAGFSAWRNSPYPERERYAALFAGMLAFAVGAAFDWFWELADIGAVFFLAGGVVVAARCAQLSQARAAANGHAEGGRFGFTIGGVAIAWIAAIALLGPLLVDREIDASRNAAASGDVGAAIDHAKRARSIEPWAASPYVQLGLLAELNGEYETAAIEFSHAINREDHNWQWYYLRSKVEHEGGDETAALEDLEKARELNPIAECLRSGWNCG